ncbi:Transcriptional regulator [Paraburkholderia unamae]|uniref:transcriptional regulator GcvA n=1 Tax=Paraburkholderia unamae TaxID=219649 RepID=UPI001CB38E90|nr:transcriptional regulator GcvA [Paraburkholderia unamae]CAG9246109.1 Transcriptional regulator [Paraburkholderia unamae]
MRKLPPLNTLRAFDAAARHRSFTLAGEELCVTHGAISKQVQLLESWLGVQVFVRTNRSIALTENGKRFHAEIALVLDRIARSADAMREQQSPRQLLVDALPTFAVRWLIPRLAAFTARHPNIEIKLTTSHDPIGTSTNAYDVIIRGGPESHEGLISDRFLDEYRTPVCAPELLDLAPLRMPTDLIRHALLHSAPLPALWSNWLAVAGLADFEPARSMVFEHFFQSIQAAIDRLGVAMGPSALVTRELSDGTLVAPFPDIRLPARSYFWYCPESLLADSTAQVFCSWLSSLRDVSPTH